VRRILRMLFLLANTLHFIILIYWL